MICLCLILAHIASMLHPTLVSGLAISALVNLTAVAFSFPAGVGIATANSAGQVQQERNT
jgi:hypothetical protein